MESHSRLDKTPNMITQLNLEFKNIEQYLE